MNESMHKLSAVAESNGAAIRSMVQIALDTSEAMFELNMSLARELSAAGRESLAGGMRSPAIANAQTGSHQFGLGADYVRNLNDILGRAQANIARVHLEQMNDLAHSLSALATSVSGNGVVGGAEMLDQLRGAMAQVSEAYEQLFQTARNIVAGTTVVAEPPAAAPQPQPEPQSEPGVKPPRRRTRGA